jgi:hypothetical protein
MIGPDSELPVNGNRPTSELTFALVDADGAVDVEPSTPVTGEIVVDGTEVEPSGPTEVLDTVVDEAIVDDVVLVELVGATVVLVVASIVVEVVGPLVVVGPVVVLVVLVLVDAEQAVAKVTEVDAEAWNPSGHVACNDKTTSPVSPPGTIVVADVVAFATTSE